MKYISCDDPKFIFIHIPKTGGTSLKKILKDKLPHFNIKFDGELVTYNKQTHIKMTLKDFNNYSNYFIFTIVRHPYDWIKSYYNFHHNIDIFYKNLFNITKKSKKSKINISFDKWLDSLKSFNQSDYFYENNKILVNKIYKLEEFNEGIYDLLTKLKLDPIFNHVQMKDAKKYNIDTIKKLNDNQKKKIQKICSKDFNLLNYDI